MTTYIQLPGNECRFVADTHFYDRSLPGEQARRDRFIGFLDSLESGIELFLLGDIFDFYFSYRTVVPRRFVDLYATFLRCNRRGVNLHFLGGNHDYWVDNFFDDDLGIKVHKNEILIETQGRRAVLAHGDLVMPDDLGYKVLKSIIRNRAVIGVSKWIHPDIMDRIANKVATTSRKYKSGSQTNRAQDIMEHAFKRFYERDNDIFVMGHVHCALHEKREGREFVLVGDWFEHFTYAKLSNGVLSLETFSS